VPPAPPPSEVTYLTIALRQVEDFTDFTGQVEAYRTVQVRSQATGVILARPFREGAEVHRGEVLYRIDPVATDAAWRSAKARLTEARARLANSEINAKRLRPLLEGNAVAKQDVDNAESQVEQARAAVDDATGAVDAARKGLDETMVRAEIDGRVGRALLDVGARVTGSDDLLTTIDVLDPIYVSFRPSSSQQLAWRRDATLRKAIEPGGSARVEATLSDGTTFPAAGRIEFIDPVIDPATGTQEYRAEFVNAQHLLLPGQFVHVRVRGLMRNNAIVVPQRAVLEQMGRQIVYVVGADNKVAVKEVKATGWSGRDWMIESGLAAGDRVVVDGVQKIGPGAPVHATPMVDSADTHANGSAR
jgi:membrane fusion protein (multidrug efflux system)